MKKFLLSALSLLALCVSAYGKVTLNAYFADHCVLPQKADSVIYGYASPGEKVFAFLGAQTGAAIADASGFWKITMDLSQCGNGPFELKVNDMVIKDVLVGEVWLCSGQSNMAFTMGAIKDMFPQEIPNSSDDGLRFFVVPTMKATAPQTTIAGTWNIAAPSTTGRCYAIPYFFAKTLRKELKRPVALICTAVGGSPIHAWHSPEAVAAQDDLKQEAVKIAGWAKEYPAKFTEMQAAWEKRSNREDRPHDAPPATGWTSKKIAYDLFGGSGAAWIRRTVSLSEQQRSNGLTVKLGAMAYPAEVWANGKKIGANTPNQIALEQPLTVVIPAADLKAGENVIALRFFNSRWSRPIPQPIAIGDHEWGRNDAWEMCNEFALPRLTNDVGRSQPILPASRFAMPSAHYNAMVAPLTNLRLSGFLWYQGEANAGAHVVYSRIFPALIQDWRKQFQDEHLPFLFCQLAAHHDKHSDPKKVESWVHLRQAQKSALALPATGMAVLTDCGEAKDIHPHDKKTPGERLAACALAIAYGRKSPYRGPAVKEVKPDGAVIRVSFDYIEGGLVAKEVPAQQTIAFYKKQMAPLVRNSPNTLLEGFAVGDAQGNWAWADSASIEGGQVVLSSKAIAAPVHVRYNMQDNPSGNLYNTAGFPAESFEK